MRYTALSDLRLVDLTTGIAGPYCTKLFCDAGAEVIKIEQPDGDPLRKYAATRSVPAGEDGALFRYLNAGKRSVTAAFARRAFDELLAGADLLVDDRSPAAVDVTAIRRRHPHLVVVTITPFGSTGPWSGRPASDLTIQAESGALLFKGRPERPPVQAGGRISEFLGGLYAAPPALAAVMRSRREGIGEHIDLSLLEVMAVAGSNFSDLYHDCIGRPEFDTPWRYLDTPAIERAADSLVAFNANTGQMFESFLLMIGRADLIGDRTYSALKSRLALGPEWQKMIDDFTTERSRNELIELANELRIPAAPVHDGCSVLDDEHLKQRGVFVKGGNGLIEPRPPYLLDGVAASRETPAPALGQDDARIGEHPAPRRVPGGRTGVLPLAGLRVLDLTSWWVGAAATQTLAFLGAEVIHIESTSHPDGMRLTGPALHEPQWWEWGYMFLAANTNKRGVTLELDTREGRHVMEKLIAGADVLVENFTPRVAERWGFGVDAVRAMNPEIVYLRMPAFGLSGPWRDRPAFAQTIEPMSGMASITGYPDDLPMAKGGLADAVAGQHGAWAALVGLAEKARRGRGVFVEATMVEAALNVTAQPVVEYSAYGTVMSRAGNRSPHAAPQGLYACRGRDSWVAISVCDDHQWGALVAAVGDAKLKDERFCSQAGRRDGHDEIDEILTSWAGDRQPDELVKLLGAHGVPAGACRDPRIVSHHPQLISRGLFEETDHPVAGKRPVPGPPFRFASVDHWLHCPAPTLGQDNPQVLAGLLGSEDELDELRNAASSAIVPKVSDTGLVDQRPLRKPSS